MKHLLDNDLTCGHCVYFLDCEKEEGSVESHICLRYPPVFIGVDNEQCKSNCTETTMCPCFYAYRSVEIGGDVICGEFKKVTEKKVKSKKKLVGRNAHKSHF